MSGKYPKRWISGRSLVLYFVHNTVLKLQFPCMLTFYLHLIFCPDTKSNFFSARFRYGLVEISKTSIITFWVRIETSLRLSERPYQTVITVQQLHTIFLNCVTLPIGHRVCLPPTNECKASRFIINASRGSRHTFNGNAVPSTAYV